MATSTKSRPAPPAPRSKNNNGQKTNGPPQAQVSFGKITPGIGHRIVAFGPGGIGKTTLAATAPGPVAFFDLDDSLSVLGDQLEGLDVRVVGDPEKNSRNSLYSRALKKSEPAKNSLNSHSPSGQGVFGSFWENKNAKLPRITSYLSRCLHHRREYWEFFLLPYAGECENTYICNVKRGGLRKTPKTPNTPSAKNPADKALQVIKRFISRVKAWE